MSLDATAVLAAGIQLLCPLERCKTTKVVAPSGGLVAGTPAKIEDLVCIPIADGDEGDEVAVIYEAPEIVLPCETAGEGDYPVGDVVIFDSDNDCVTTTESATAITPCGVVTKAAETGDTTVQMSLMASIGLLAATIAGLVSDIDAAVDRLDAIDTESTGALALLDARVTALEGA